MFGAEAQFCGTAGGRFVDNDAPIVIPSGDKFLAFATAQVSMALTTISARLVLVGLPLLLRSARCGALAHA